MCGHSGLVKPIQHHQRKKYTFLFFYLSYLNIISLADENLGRQKLVYSRSETSLFSCWIFSANRNMADNRCDGNIFYFIFFVYFQTNRDCS